MGHGRAGVGIEEANLLIGSCRELIDNLLIFVHSDKAGLRKCFQWRTAGKVIGLGPLWREKHGGHFFDQENKNTDNAQDDGNPSHGHDGLSKPIKDATPHHISGVLRYLLQGRMAIRPCSGRGGQSGITIASQDS